VIEPVAKDNHFLLTILKAMGEEPEALHLSWLGQSGFLLGHQNASVVLDPYLSDSLTEKYRFTGNPHIRMSARVIAPGFLHLLAVRAVAATHQHSDHLDGETLRAMMYHTPRPKLIAPESCRLIAAQRAEVPAEEVIGLDDGSTADIEPFHLTAIPSAHEAVEKDNAGHCLYLGYVVRLGNWCIYHSGDTVLYDGLVERLASLCIDIALLPINGRSPERRVAGNLNGREAAQLAKDIGAKLVIPCHYDMFTFNTADPYEQFVPECERLGQRYRVLKLGERFSFP